MRSARALRCINFILFNVTLRVYCFRLLVLVTAGSFVYLLIAPDHQISWGHDSNMGICLRARTFAIGTYCLILGHHIALVFKWRLKLAAVDWFLVILEIGGVVYLTSCLTANLDGLLVTFGVRVLRVALSLILAALIASGIFRAATIYKSIVPAIDQPFNLFGECPDIHPPYTPVGILLNRSVARPLVRGELPVIMVLRALVLSCLCLGLPAYAIYTTTVRPLSAPVYTRTVNNAGTYVANLYEDPALIAFRCDFPMSIFRVSGTVNKYSKLANTVQECPVDSDRYSGLATCPLSWTSYTNITICMKFELTEAMEFEHTEEASVAVYPGIGDEIDIIENSKGIDVLAGAHLAAFVDWKFMRKLTQTQGVALFRPAMKTIVISEFTALQPDPSPPATCGGLQTATLTLRSRNIGSTSYIEEYTDTSWLDAVAALGGFWTFVNGAFAVVFGANVLYFLFRRRPLSALGLIHIFQRRTLARNWSTDFPAIYSEGGRPGTENAGIVAFIRERLVDLNEDEMRDVEDAEDQRCSQKGSHSPISSRYSVYSRVSVGAKEVENEEDGNATGKVLNTVPSTSEMGSTVENGRAGYR
ncbi:hypothetical protein C8J57DRAFT_1218681 [Mycena rebaudengoi]|nr:hypothetical protein C8J57DRAFT_1218681 [Mycena rebaudengoi]